MSLIRRQLEIGICLWGRAGEAVVILKMSVRERNAPSSGRGALIPSKTSVEGEETYLDADVELDVCVGVFDCHG